MIIVVFNNAIVAAVWIKIGGTRMCVGKPVVQVKDDKLGWCGGAEEKGAVFEDMQKTHQQDSVMNWKWGYEREEALYITRGFLAHVTGWEVC